MYPTLLLKHTKHVFYMFNIIMIIKIMIFDMQIALADTVYWEHNIFNPNVLNVLYEYKVTIVILWCSIRTLIWILFCSQTKRSYLFSMYNTCKAIILLIAMLNNTFSINGLLRERMEDLMSSLYTMLNAKHERAQSPNSKFSVLKLFYRRPARLSKTINFENYLKKLSLILLTIILQRHKKCHSKIKTLAYLSKFVSHAQKNTWTCLSRAVSRSSLVLVMWTFKCVSPHFRNKSKHADANPQKMDFYGKNLAKIYKKNSFDSKFIQMLVTW